MFDMNISFFDIKKCQERAKNKEKMAILGFFYKKTCKKIQNVI